MPKTILIQDPDVLISLDLAQTVMETWPDARVILCRDVPQILAALTEGSRADLLVIRQSQRSASGFGLADLLRHSGTRVLLTGADEDDAATVEALGWRALDMPFLAAQVRHALCDACPEVARSTDRLCNGDSVR